MAEQEVSAFALRLNQGQHWFLHLHHGLVSSSCTAMQLLVVAAHYYAIVHVAPSMASLAAKGYGRPAIADKQAWLFDGVKLPYSPRIANPFSMQDEKQSKSEGPAPPPPPLKKPEANGEGSLSKESILSILTSDPATMLYDAAQLLMAERQPPPSPPTSDADAPVGEGKCAAHPTRPKYFEDARYVLQASEVPPVALYLVQILQPTSDQRLTMVLGAGFSCCPRP